MRRLIRYLVVISSLQFYLNLCAIGQYTDIGNFVAGGTEDAEKLLTAYFSPYLNGFGASLSGGWHTTAKPHKPGGFDINITSSVAIVPDELKTFDVDALELTTLVRGNGSQVYSQTAAGARESGPVMNYDIRTAGGDILYDTTAFTMPKGTGFGYVPSCMIQAGVGLFKGTEILGRYLPDIGSDNFKVGFWGVGLKHDIKQWIPGLKRVPILNIAAMGGYTKLNANVILNVDAADLNIQTLFPENTLWENQKLLMSSSSFTGNLLVSADLPVICFYGGVGFVTTKANFKLAGEYPMITGINEATLMPVAERVTDPVDIEVKNTEGTRTKPRLNIGFRLKMGFFTIHADYTYAKFNMITAGFGITFR